MPSRRSRSPRSRSRSRSPEREPSRHRSSRHHHRSRSRTRSRSPEKDVDLPWHAKPISSSDYFRKSDEFRVWLKDEKNKYLDEITGEKARSHASYFRKFVKAWNRGKLPDTLYRGIDPATQRASSQTGFQWSFAKNRSRVDSDALLAIRSSVQSDTYATAGPSSRRTNLNDDDDDGEEGPSSFSSRRGRAQGPTLPSANDLTLAREAAAESVAAERKYERQRDKRDARDRLEEVVGPKPVGREGMLEKKRAQREGDRAFRERGDDGFVEMDESSLMGGGDSFREQIARRDAARARYQQKTQGAREERMNATREKANAMRDKEKATMDMFQQLAKQRFG